MNYLKLSYQIGGIYDLLLGFGVLLLRNYLLKLLHQTVPNIPQVSDALGLFLIAYGYLLIDESRKESPRLNIGLTSSIVRIVFFLLIIYYFLFMEVEFLYIVFGFTDLITGIIILIGLKTYFSDFQNKNN